MRTFCLSLITGLFSITAGANNTASSLPNTDIFLAKIAHQRVISVENITKRNGYDNQPNFSDKGLLYTAAFKHGDRWQTDTMLYEFDSQKTNNLTNSEVSEYSPTQVPNENGFSVILEDQNANQELWQYSFNGLKKAFRLRKENGKIGYHAWGQNKDLITFVLGEPHALYFGNTDKQTGYPVAQNIGRSLAYNQVLDAYSFSQYKQDGQWVTLYNHNDNTLNTLLKLPSGVDYYAWRGHNSLIYADGTKVYSWYLDKKEQPALWLDFTDHCEGKITRLKYQTASHQLAFVCEHA